MATLPMADEFYKADKHGHHFQKRHFRWDGTVLSWYHKPTDKKARGELDLTASGASLASNFTAGMLGKPPTRHVFAITTKKRVLKLAFDTEDMRNRWFEALGEYHGTVDTSRYPDSVELHLNIVGARNLLALDVGGTSDPYIKLRVCSPKNDEARRAVLQLLGEATHGAGADQHSVFELLEKKKQWKTVQAAKTTRCSKTCNPLWNLELVVNLNLADVLVCDVFDHDMITSDDSLGSFVLLPEWYVPELPGVQLPDSPPLGRIGFGFKRADHWWPLHPVGSHKAAGKVQLTVVNKEAEAQQAAASSQDESKADGAAHTARAGSLIAGSSARVRDEMAELRKRQAAAIKLQCAWRRHAAQKRVQALREQKAKELAELQQRSDAALRIQAAHRGRMGRQQVAALRAKQKVEMEAKAREVVAIKLQAAWRGRQGRMRVKKLRAELAQKRKETEAALAIQAAFRRQRTNRRIAARRAAMDEANRRAEAEANALDSLRRMGARGNPPPGQIEALLAADPSLTEAEARAQIAAAMKLQCRFRCLQAKRHVAGLRAARAKKLAEEEAQLRAIQAAEEAAARATAEAELAAAKAEADRAAAEEAARAAAYAARVAAKEHEQQELARKQAKALAQRQAEVKAAIMIQTAWRGRQARRRVDNLREQQRREIASAVAAQEVGVELHAAALRRKATRNAAERLIDLEEEETANTLAQLDDELQRALKELRLASKALKLAWHRVSGPVRHKQQEMLAATSDHRASRLRWEAQELTKSLAHQVEGEKNRVVAARAEVARLQARKRTVQSDHDARMVLLKAQAAELAAEERRRDERRATLGAAAGSGTGASGKAGQSEPAAARNGPGADAFSARGWVQNEHEPKGGCCVVM